ncbi:hypothetical protein L1887_22844 [Cichorium endivia]|nr:hypothetical protein L1887_22844 [Cichorium endivia]
MSMASLFNQENRRYYKFVGDGLLISNSKRIERAIHEHAPNALLLKVNQIGAVTEAIEVAKMAKDDEWEL